MWQQFQEYLDATIVESLENQKIEKPRQVQADAIPFIDANCRRDVVCVAPVGSGKTTLIAVTVLEKLLNYERKQVIIICNDVHAALYMKKVCVYQNFKVLKFQTSSLSSSFMTCGEHNNKWNWD